NLVINQAKDEVLDMCEVLKKKQITDKHLLYLYNMVIVPRIEYRTQITYLSPTECNNIITPFRKLFKHKLKMSISMPNAILENNLIYKFRDLVEVQRQAKITNFFIQINDNKLLGKITDIRLRILQQKEWLRFSPLYEWPYDVVTRRHYKSFIAAMISLCKENKFIFNLTKNKRYEILEGHTEIHSILNHVTFNKYRCQLQKHSIMFIDQLTSLD
ncbi:4554_t:CDS:1, partial [Entrophospora sp. SA101]